MGAGSQTELGKHTGAWTGGAEAKVLHPSSSVNSGETEGPGFASAHWREPVWPGCRFR